MTQRPKKLLGQVCDAVRLKQYANGTEHRHVSGIKRCGLFFNVPHAAEMTTASLATIPANDDNLPPRECPVPHRHAWANAILTIQIKSCIMKLVP